MFVVILIVTGLAVGFISSFFGVGGGIITVPILYTLFPKIPPQTVIASSLGVIFVNSIINTRNFAKAGKKPILKLAIILAIFMMLGVVIGGQLAIVLDGKLIKLIFAIVTALVAVKTIFTNIKPDKVANWARNISAKILVISAITALLGGVIAGLTGLGGGAILVPLFITLLHMPFNWVPVYSNIAMGFGCLAGITTYMLANAPKDIFAGNFIEHMQVGYVNWAIVLFIFIGAFISSSWGVKANEKVDAKLAKNLFAALLIIFSVRIFISALS